MGLISDVTLTCHRDGFRAAYLDAVLSQPGLMGQLGRLSMFGVCAPLPPLLTIRSAAHRCRAIA